MQDAQEQVGGARGMRKVGEWGVRVLAAFVILEPIWMLLPFAGFLYGSVLRIESLNRNSSTAWLTHFVFPVLTGGWLGPVLVVLGFGVFLVGAGQIYAAKWRRTGLVTNGLYRFVRNPQYISLTLFGLGILLTWGRAITFIAFFAMMFLYYYLAKSEERSCRRLFGTDYDEYRERTSFVIPGDRALRPLGATLSRLGLPAPVRGLVGFASAMVLCGASMWLINAVKAQHMHVPYLSATIALDSVTASPECDGMTSGVAAGIPFVRAGQLVVVRGPHVSARAPGFAERLAQRLPESARLAQFFSRLDRDAGDLAIVFCGSYGGGRKGVGSEQRQANPDGRGPAPRQADAGLVRAVLLGVSLAPGTSLVDVFGDNSKRDILCGCVALIDLDSPSATDIVQADGRTRGPGFPAEERWDYFKAQFKSMPAQATDSEHPTAAPGTWPSARFALVQAPMLRTRLDPPFAQEIQDRLSRSPTFRRRLCDVGAGGGVVAVGFPRPGPNWYREHHGRPQVSVMVMLARLAENSTFEQLFHSDDRELLGAFIADIDFRTPRSEDSVTQVTAVGPRRDLHQRWRFYLSGIGGGVAGHVH